jgi:hypothetical protein
LFNEKLLQVREKGKLKPMTNSLGVKQNSIMKVGDMLLMSLTSMEENRHVFTINLDWSFMPKNLLTEMIDFFSEVFFIDHVKSRNQFS